jgi:hypothetical protein
MSDEEKPSTDDLENLPDPDTDTGEKFPAMEAIPVAEPTAPATPPPPAPAGAPEGPRIFPQQYKMLFANTCILVGTLTVWERHQVTGMPDLYGFQSIGGAFVLAASGYCILVGVVSLIRGGMRLGSSLLSSFFALYFGISSMLRLYRHGNFLEYGDWTSPPHNKGAQAAINALLGQFGPGHYLTLLGGAVILWMFIKAMFFSKKKAPEPATRRRR